MYLKCPKAPNKRSREIEVLTGPRDRCNFEGKVFYMTAHAFISFAVFLVQGANLGRIQVVMERVDDGDSDTESSMPPWVRAVAL